MARILMPLPLTDFDPTESGVPWKTLTARGHDVVFATLDGSVAAADARMVEGTGLGVWRGVLRADARGRAAYSEMAASAAFAKPLRYEQIDARDFDAIVLAGGHAPGMRESFESGRLQSVVASFFARQAPVGAICHGVVLAARSRTQDGRSVLHGRRSTALTREMELMAWAMTALWLGRYYRTYPTTVQDEVSAALGAPSQFLTGPKALLRDSPEHLERGFTVRDGRYLSARWPGDAHRFAEEFASVLTETIRA